MVVSSAAVGVKGTAAVLAVAGLVAGALALSGGAAGESSPRAGAATSGAGPAAARASAPSVPKIKHYFVIILENENADDTFGADSKAPYLAKTLPARGAFIPNYFATGHLSLDNYISMVSGQGPNNVTQADCGIYTEFAPATPTSDGQYIGQGCVYPSAVKNVANQLESKGLRWKGYMEDMASPGSDPSPTCRHPEVGATDTTQQAEVNDQYAARHNPFVYFHSIIDTPSCAKNDVDLNRLPRDLRSPARTADYNFISPDLCSDGHDEPCVDGRPGGLVSANDFLKTWVPRILTSRAYRDHGMLLITFDEAEASGAEADSSACCGEVTGPNTSSNGFFTHPGPGGGRIGAVALSPCTRPGTTDQTPYNHYSQLRFVEQNFGLGLLGYAAAPGLSSFGRKLLNVPGCGQSVGVASVRPAVARRGVRTRFTVRVRPTYSDCLAGVRVRIGRARARTNRRGIARLRTTLGTPGRKLVRANKRGCKPSTLRIRVKR